MPREVRCVVRCHTASEWRSGLQTQFFWTPQLKLPPPPLTDRIPIRLHKLDFSALSPATPRARHLGSGRADLQPLIPGQSFGGLSAAHSHCRIPPAAATARSFLPLLTLILSILFPALWVKSVVSGKEVGTCLSLTALKRMNMEHLFQDPSTTVTAAQSKRCWL